MSQRIRYSLGLMALCILGIILTQGFWLYKDYRYYRGQPLFSTNYDFYLKAPEYSGIKKAIPTVMPRISADEISEMSPLLLQNTITTNTTTAVPTVPAIPIGNSIPASPLVETISASTTLDTVSAGTTANANLPVLIAYPAGKAGEWSRTTAPGVLTPRIMAVGGLMATRQVASLKDSAMYRTIPFEAPLSHILKKMKWQFGGSILLILFTSSCFIYMIVTILMQRKLSTAKNDFIHTMTHELKTPLATVSVAIEAMMNFGALENKSKTKRYLDISQKELDHLSKMIEMIMQLSIYESHEMELAKSPIQVKTLIDEVVEKYTLSEKTQITINHNPGIPEILADKTHLGNVIRNLIDNSIKYTKEPAVIFIDTWTDQNNCVISIKDNGPGIPKKYQKSVFEKFFRIPNPGKPVTKGFGLGLSYVKQVVELHHGTILLFSEEGLGCRFTIHIPLNSFQ